MLDSKDILKPGVELKAHIINLSDPWVQEIIAAFHMSIEQNIENRKMGDSTQPMTI